MAVLSLSWTSSLSLSIWIGLSFESFMPEKVWSDPPCWATAGIASESPAMTEQETARARLVRRIGRSVRALGRLLLLGHHRQSNFLVEDQHLASVLHGHPVRSDMRSL